MAQQAPYGAAHQAPHESCAARIAALTYPACIMGVSNPVTRRATLVNDNAAVGCAALRSRRAVTCSARLSCAFVGSETAKRVLAFNQ